MSDKEPIQIEVSSSPIVTVDVSNKVTSVVIADILTALGYTPQDTANKVTSFQYVPDDIHYPTEKLVNDTFVTLENNIQAKWDGFVTLSNPTAGDVLIHDGNNFKNQAMAKLTDGGNW